MKRIRKLAASLAGNPGAADKGDHLAIGTTLEVARDSVLRSFPSVAMVAESDGRIVGASELAAPLVKALEAGALREIPRLVASTLATGPRYETVKLDGGGSYDLAFLPLVDDGVLMIGRETTLDRNLQNALIDSRQRYKDFVECSSDFAWETAADGRLRFVSPRGALGRPAADLVGRDPTDLIHERHDEPLPLPFHSEVALDRASVWMRGADGAAICVETASLPLFDGNGRWTGARGVCRDVTEERARDEALARARRRERVVTRLVGTIRDELDPDKLLSRAAEATGDALGAVLCWIYCSRSDGSFYRAAVFGSIDSRALELEFDKVTSKIARAEGATVTVLNGYLFLAAPSRHHYELNGAICVARRVDAAPWDDDDGALLLSVAEHLGIAIEQIETHRALTRLSRTDDLTGLLNRRAFTDELGRRHALAVRNGRPASLLYLDLDNFKRVNDVHGHQRGDEALRIWTGVLNQETRESDVIARLGGDEFAVWLDETDDAGAEKKAAGLLKASDCLKPYSGDADHPLCVSIGVAVLDPGAGESLDQIIARADAAMYSAKHSGKGAFAMARPVAAPRRAAQ